MRTNLRVAWVWLVVSFVAPPGHGQKASEPVVTLDSGSTVQLCSGCTPRDIRLAVMAKSGLKIKRSKTRQENPTVIEASFGNVRDSSLAEQFTPRWELSSSGVPQALLIRVSDKVRRAGNYDLILNLQPRTDPTAPRLKLQVVHATSKLEVPDKLLINRTEYWPFCATTEKMQLDVRESSAASDIVDVTLQSRPSTLGTELTTGRLILDVQPPLSANAVTPSQGSGNTPGPFLVGGQTRTLNYDIADEFPLGVVSGSVRLLAPELTDPATLTFEVHSKLTKWYILVAIIAGLGLSWYLKVYLHDRIELADAVAKAAALLDRIQTDWNSHQDHLFRKALEEPLRTLADAIEDRDAARIAVAMPPLDQAWRGALQNYATLNQTATDALDELRKAVDSSWIIPPAAARVLSEIKQDRDDQVNISDVQQQLAHGNASEAANLIGRLRRHLGQQLRSCGQTWHDNIIRFLGTLTEARAGIPAAIVTQFAAAREKSQQQLSRMNPDQLIPDPATAAIIQFLRDFEGEFRAAGELLTELSQRLREEWTEFKKVLDLSDQEAAGFAELARLGTELNEFTNALPQAVSRPEVDLEEINRTLDDLQGAWRAAIVEQLETVPEDHRPNVDNLLRHQDFLTAAEQIAAARAAGHENVALGGDVQIEQPSAPEWPEMAGLFPSSSLSIVSSSTQFVAMPATFSGLHLQSSKDVKKAKGLQTLMVAALAVVYSYTTYSKTFGGTWSDISTIFFAAFAIDVAFDAIVSKITPKSA